MVHFAEINQAPPPYSMFQYIGRVATLKLVPRNCLRYFQATLIMVGRGLVLEFMWGIVVSFLPIYSMKQFTLTSSLKTLLCLDSSHHHHFPNHWSMQILFYSTIRLLKRSLILSNANTKIWSKKWVLMQLKCFFSNPGTWRFLAMLMSDTKISKLTLCFSILLFRLVSELRKI